MSEVEQAFEELFFGNGMILGLLLYLTVVGLSALKVKYLGVLYAPLSFVLVLEYLDRATNTNNCFWGAILVCLSIPFLIINIFRGKSEF